MKRHKAKVENHRRLGAPAGGQQAKNTDDRCERKRGSIQEMYRERESGLQRGLKKREKVGEPLQRENNKYWSQNSSQQVKVSHARSLWR